MSLTTAALIGAGANFVGNMIGARSQKSANDNNLKIAQMNNEWSERMMQKQMDYNTMMWEKQNEYNDPSNYVKRLEKAGVNPAAVLSNGNFGSASANSVGLPSPTGTTMHSFRPDFSGIGNSLMTAYQLEGVRKQQDAQAKFLETQSDWYGAKAMADIAEAFSNVRNTELRSKAQAIQNNWLDAQLGAQYINQIRTNQSLEVSILNSIRQGMLLDKDIASYDARLNGDLSEQLSRIALNFASGELSLRQADKVLSETWTDIEKRIGMKIDNEIKARTKEQVIERAHQPQNPYQLGWDGMLGAKQALSDFGNWMVKDLSKSKILKWSKRSWKDTKRSFGLYF